MKTFSSNKTITELGIDTTRKFVVVSKFNFETGDILTLHKDDNTSAPYFENQEGRRDCIFLDEISYCSEEEKPLPRWVYVDDYSVEKALNDAEKYLLVFEGPENIKNRYICVNHGNTLEEGNTFKNWNYIAEMPPEDGKVENDS